jgi:hypothetical protein
MAQSVCHRTNKQLYISVKSGRWRTEYFRSGCYLVSNHAKEQRVVVNIEGGNNRRLETWKDEVNVWSFVPHRKSRQIPFDPCQEA